MNANWADMNHDLFSHIDATTSVSKYNKTLSSLTVDDKKIKIDNIIVISVYSQHINFFI